MPVINISRFRSLTGFIWRAETCSHLATCYHLRLLASINVGTVFDRISGAQCISLRVGRGGGGGKRERERALCCQSSCGQSHVFHLLLIHWTSLEWLRLPSGLTGNRWKRRRRGGKEEEGKKEEEEEEEEVGLSPGFTGRRWSTVLVGSLQPLDAFFYRCVIKRTLKR